MFNKDFYKGAYHVLEQAIEDDDMEDVLEAVVKMLTDINQSDMFGMLPLYFFGRQDILLSI
ncbi:MAG: hypothetical protein K5787_01765 [Lentisphaeria bacterium]|nr:hypothetical protein [Victivallales bacterium]MBR6057076.1 hypothetical protein [Victivallales bacterium]MCR4572472.1 hypothetical protein [Lentisphaeria bacterium]